MQFLPGPSRREGAGGLPGRGGLPPQRQGGLPGGGSGGVLIPPRPPPPEAKRARPYVPHVPACGYAASALAARNVNQEQPLESALFLVAV